MDILKLLNRNFKSGGYLLAVFDHENTEPENKNRKLLEAIKFIKKELGRDMKYIWFRYSGDSKTDFVCGCIFVSEHPNVIQMSKEGIRAGYMEIPKKSFPWLADLMNSKAEGKLGTSTNCRKVTRTLRSRYRNTPRLYHVLRRKRRGAGKRNFLKGP